MSFTLLAESRDVELISRGKQFDNTALVEIDHIGIDVFEQPFQGYQINVLEFSFSGIIF